MLLYLLSARCKATAILHLTFSFFICTFAKVLFVEFFVSQSFVPCSVSCLFCGNNLVHFKKFILLSVLWPFSEFFVSVLKFMLTFFSYFYKRLLAEMPILKPDMCPKIKSYQNIEITYRVRRENDYKYSTVVVIIFSTHPVKNDAIQGGR